MIQILCNCGADEGSEEDEDDRLEQQMGDVGDTAEAVDERLWNNEDEEGKAPEQVKCSNSHIAIFCCWLRVCMLHTTAQINFCAVCAGT